ncbi:MAG: hypothetical protein U0R26_04545 [Solirubrobacterales bacterium]
MSKRPILILGLAMAVAAIAATAAIAGPVGAPVPTKDGNSQAVGSVIGPKKLFKKTFTPGTLEVTTKLTTSTAPNGVPNPTVNVVIDFDKNAKIFTKGIPTCDPAKLQNTSTEIAKQQCGKAEIGKGTAEALIPVGEKVFPATQTVTAFNGVPQGGKPVVVLHSYGTTPVQTTLVLVGTVTNFNKEGYGPRLDINVPLIAGGAGALTYFNTKIDKKYTYKGKPVSFISAKCPNSKKLKTRSVFTFKDGESSNPTYIQACKQRTEPKRK